MTSIVVKESFISSLRPALSAICGIEETILAFWLAFVTSVESIVSKTSLGTFFITVAVMKVGSGTVDDVKALDTVLGGAAKLAQV